MTAALEQRNDVGGRLFWGLIALSSVALALGSFRYLVGVGPMPPKIVANAFAAPWLIIHVAASAWALLVGAFQFGGIRMRWPAVHRWTGRSYAVACLVGAVTGFVLALGTTMGPVATAGFGTLSIVWTVTTVRGWQLALQGRFGEHRRWMIRSFALTFAAVNLRLYLAIAFALGFQFADSYPVISFLAWVPNLLAVELYLWRSQRDRLVRA